MTERYFEIGITLLTLAAVYAALAGGWVSPA